MRILAFILLFLIPAQGFSSEQKALQDFIDAANKISTEKSPSWDLVFDKLRQTYSKERNFSIPDKVYSDYSLALSKLLFEIGEKKIDLPPHAQNKLVELIKDATFSESFQNRLYHSLKGAVPTKALDLHRSLILSNKPEEIVLGMNLDINPLLPPLNPTPLIKFFTENINSELRNEIFSSIKSAGHLHNIYDWINSHPKEMKAYLEDLKKGDALSKSLAITLLENASEEVKKPHIAYVLDQFRKKTLSPEDKESAERILYNSTADTLASIAPQIIAWIDAPATPSEDRTLGLSLLAQSDSPEAISRIMKEIEKPLDLNFSFNELKDTRSRLKDLAFYLSNLFARKPGLLDGPVRKRVKQYLINPTPGLGAAKNALRRNLPSSIKIPLENEIAKESVASTNKDPCQIQCRLVEHYASQLETIQIKPLTFFDKLSEAPLEMAIREKIAEFLYKAGPQCGRNDLPKKILNWFSKPIQTQEETNTFANNASVGEVNEQLRQSSSDLPALQQMEAFLKQVESGLTGKNPLPRSSPYVFAFAHLGQLLNLIENDISEDDRPLFKKNQATVQKWLETTYKHLPDLTGDNTPSASSVLATYHYSVAALGYPVSKENPFPFFALCPLTNTRASVLRSEKDAGAIPYSLIIGECLKELTELKKETSSSQDTTQAKLDVQDEWIERVNADQKMGKIREASARAVPFNLAIYWHGSRDDKERKKNSGHLLTSLENYRLYFYDLFEGKDEDRTHDYQDDALAPYFGPSTVSYALEAASILAHESSLSEADRQKAAKLGEDISLRLQSLFPADGIISGHSKTYQGAEQYENAFAGLAFFEACALSTERKEDEASRLKNHVPGSHSSGSEEH